MLNSLVERQRGPKVWLLSKKLEADANYERRTFRYIFLQSLHECDVEVSITTFYGGQKHTKKNFSFSFRRWVGASRIQLKENSPTSHVKIERVGIITTN